MTYDTLWMLLRYLLIAGGSYATGKGWVTDGDVTAIIAAAGTVSAALWGIYVRFGTKSVTAATADRRDVPTVSAATGAVQK